MRQLCLTALQNSSISNYRAPQEQVVRKDGGFFGGLYMKCSTQTVPELAKHGARYCCGTSYAVLNGNFLLPD